MHLAIAVFLFLATWRWGDLRNWQRYNASMLFIIMGNFFYHFLYSGQLLWEMKSDFLWNYKFAELIYSFVTLPFTTILFLTNFPNEFNKKLLRILLFIAIYAGIEVVLLQFGRIQYHRGWTIWMSIAWDCMMFPVIALHYKKPLMSYLVSFIVFVTMITAFPVS